MQNSNIRLLTFSLILCYCCAQNFESLEPLLHNCIIFISSTNHFQYVIPLISYYSHTKSTSLILLGRRQKIPESILEFAKSRYNVDKSHQYKHAKCFVKIYHISKSILTNLWKHDEIEFNQKPMFSIFVAEFLIDELDYYQRRDFLDIFQKASSEFSDSTPIITFTADKKWYMKCSHCKMEVKEIILYENELKNIYQVITLWNKIQWNFQLIYVRIQDSTLEKNSSVPIGKTKFSCRSSSKCLHGIILQNHNATQSISSSRAQMSDMIIRRSEISAHCLTCIKMSTDVLYKTFSVVVAVNKNYFRAYALFAVYDIIVWICIIIAVISIFLSFCLMSIFTKRTDPIGNSFSQVIAFMLEQGRINRINLRSKRHEIYILTSAVIFTLILGNAYKGSLLHHLISPHSFRIPNDIMTLASERECCPIILLKWNTEPFLESANIKVSDLKGGLRDQLDSVMKSLFYKNQNPSTNSQMTTLKNIDDYKLHIPVSNCYITSTDFIKKGKTCDADIESIIALIVSKISIPLVKSGTFKEDPTICPCLLTQIVYKKIQFYRN